MQFCDVLGLDLIRQSGRQEQTLTQPPTVPPPATIAPPQQGFPWQHHPLSFSSSQLQKAGYKVIAGVTKTKSINSLLLSAQFSSVLEE